MPGRSGEKEGRGLIDQKEMSSPPRGKANAQFDSRTHLNIWRNKEIQKLTKRVVTCLDVPSHLSPDSINCSRAPTVGA